MPSYDAVCAQCSYEAIEIVKIAELPAWDLGARCPQCDSADGAYHRVIRGAQAIRGGSKGVERAAAAQKADAKAKFVKSGERDAMLHKQGQRADQQQRAEARQIVKSGKYEGF